MEQDFKASKMEEEEEKVQTAISYFIDDTTLWWGRIDSAKSGVGFIRKSSL